MKKLIFTLITICTLTSMQPAQAGGLFDLDEVMNVVSFGAVGRARDRARAEGARLLALEQELAAQKLKQKEMETILEKNAIIGSSLASDQEILSSLELMADLVESQKIFLVTIVELLFANDVKAVAISQIVALQQSDLLKFINFGLAKDPKNTTLIRLQYKVQAFHRQLIEFPNMEMDDEELNEVVDDALIASNQTIELLETIVKSLKAKIEEQKAAIARNKKKLEELKKPPKPKVQPKPRIDWSAVPYCSRPGAGSRLGGCIEP